MRSRRLADGGARTFVLIFEAGDEVVAGVEGFAAEQAITAASLQGIGAFSDVLLGFFERDSRDYRRIPIDEQVEVLALLGDVALADGRPKLHAHVVVGKRDGSAHGGHLLAAHVWPTLEVVLVDAPDRLQRVHDAASGLALIRP